MGQDERAAFSSRIAADQSEFEAEFGQIIGRLSPISPLNEAAIYSLSSGGKRIRPILVLEVADLLQIPRWQVIPFAAAVECLHTSSLIHDDLPCLDNDDERRGRPTCHRAFDEPTALLAGDFLIAKAFDFAMSSGSQLIAPEVRLAWGRLIAEATLALCEGQVLDVGGTVAGSDRNASSSVSQLHALKTGALFEAAVAGPACLLLDEKDRIEVQGDLRRFGAKLGLLFQITDDLLDADELSRDSGNEITREMKEEPNAPTDYVSAYGKSGAGELADACAAEAIEALGRFKERSGFLEQLVGHIRSRTI